MFTIYQVWNMINIDIISLHFLSLSGHPSSSFVNVYQRVPLQHHVLMDQGDVKHQKCGPCTPKLLKLGENPIYST